MSKRLGCGRACTLGRDLVASTAKRTRWRKRRMKEKHQQHHRQHRQRKQKGSRLYRWRLVQLRLRLRNLSLRLADQDKPSQQLLNVVFVVCSISIVLSHRIPKANTQYQSYILLPPTQSDTESVREKEQIEKQIEICQERILYRPFVKGGI